MKTNPFLLKMKIYKFFDDFILIYPLYALMFEDFGISVSRISILFLAWSITSFVLEVPSGVFADKYDRRTVLIVAQLFRVFGYLTWLLFPTFIGFFVGFIFWGLKSAFTSGTWEAFLYDGLEEQGKLKLYSKELGALNSISFIAILCASSLATIAFPLGYSWILVISIISLLISTFSLLSLESFNSEESTKEKEYFKILRKGVKDVFQDSKAFLIVLIGSFFIGIMAIDEYFTLFIEKSRVAVVYVGIIFAVYTLLQSLGSLIAHKLEKLNGAVVIFLILFGISFWLVSTLSGIGSVIAFVLLGFIVSIARVINSAKLQSIVESSVRSTVASVVGFIAEIIAFSVYLLTSFLSNSFGLIGTFRYLSYVVTFVIIVLMVGYITNSRNDKRLGSTS